MTSSNESVILKLAASVLGIDAAKAAIDKLDLAPALDSAGAAIVSRASFAMALNIVLFDDLLARVPTGAAYVADVTAGGGKVFFDHGALRTIRFADGATGALPAGEEAFARILKPLGYTVANVYPLPRLNMTGRAYCHQDAPESIPQFFVSELHVERFGPEFERVARRVFGSSRDPLGVAAHAALARFAEMECAAFDLAVAALPEIVAAFGCHHDTPALADYEALLARSAEAAWIATEGNAFNHATDRVPDVETLSDAQRALGRLVKDAVEVSTNGRVRQTAFRADQVERLFVDGDGATVARRVPGSFYEFITRDVDPATGKLDLGFDSSNAQGIFAMTKAA
ncbi:2-oxoadipate dioxygenase/decarboxylase family protein [Sphingomonas cavernae]|uniref:2-oxoadipate dioxygenase/decarboxylase n=1 Tax=Sphingomonas cavernae TaxID=2320861 RepID=A0A418W7G9_9SPHN|nr:DUF1338 family protein [Sphingomonas cavernae]RJF85804.1 DUF1338 family protein [Sphingomonas cavernae]